MRTMILLFITCALVACKSQKNSVANNSLTLDSIATSVHNHSVAVIDSTIIHSDFSFDSLKIEVIRPEYLGEPPTVIRLNAVKGRIIDRKQLHRDSLVSCNSIDTVAYHMSAVGSETQHSVSTRTYNPPDGTIIAIIAVAVAALLFWLLYRNR